MSELRSRRDLLTGWLDRFCGPTGSPLADPGPDPDKVLRPPGALTPDEEFCRVCTGCGECLPVCPTASLFTIKAADKQLPAISPAQKACYLCSDLHCIRACPEGALKDPGGPDQVRLGIAKVDPRRCVTFAGQPCDACFKVCPLPHRAINLIGGRPLVTTGGCTGCGLCEFVCPEPLAIVVIAERHLVAGLRVPKTEYPG